MTDAQVSAYKDVLKLELSSIHIPINAIMCTDVSCSDNDHFESINNYVECISKACLRAAECTVPHTRARGNRGSIPGWTELVAPYRSNSLFWHNMWVECGKPRTGVVYDIMRQTRARYHYAIRYARRHENDIINDRFANALLLNSGRDFWSAVKKIRRSGSCVSGAVDGVSNASDIVSLFARKYEDLYTSVAYDPVVMKQISQELNSSLESTGYDVDCIVDMSDVLGLLVS